MENLEEIINKVSNGLGSFCNHLQSSCDALTQSVHRRPIPLDSASSTFIQCLNHRVSGCSNDLNLLERMSFGTVSFEELLGHCNEIYKQNQTYLLELQDHLVENHGFAPEIEIYEGEDYRDLDSEFINSKDGLSHPPSSYYESQSAANSFIKSLEDDPLLDESLSLKSLGISEVSLATLASGAKRKIDDAYISLQEPMGDQGHKVHEVKGSYHSVVKSLGAIEGKMKVDQKHVEIPGPVMVVSKDDYESLPSHIKSLSSWEDLLLAVEKINSNLSKKETTKGYKYLHQDEIASLGLGPKGKAYLLLLVKMERLAIETLDGAISYRVRQD